MGWSAAWRARRARGDGERRRLRVIRIGGPDAVGQPTWAVDDLGSDPPGAHLAKGGLRPAGQRLTMEWVSSTGGWRVDLAGDVSGLMLDAWRGQPVVYEIGYEDHAEGVLWEPVMIGVLDDWQRESLAEERWRLTVLDLVGALQSRMVEGSTRWALFATLDTALTLPTGGGYDISDAAIVVDRTETDYPTSDEIGLGLETGQRGAVILRADDDERFLRTFTAIGVTPSAHPDDRWFVSGVETSTAAQWDLGVPTNTNLTRVQPCALLTGHPLRVALRILASTGTGENGPDDVYPASWGYGIPHELIDREDALGWLASLHDDSVTERSQWALVVEEPQPDGLAWLAGQLSRVGMWLTVRQGRITVRGATAIADPGAPPVPHYGTLSAYAMVEGLSYRAWTGGRSAEAYRLSVLCDRDFGLSLVDPLRSRPAIETVEVDLRDWLRREGTTGLLPDATRTARRLAPWVMRTCGWLRTRTAHPMAPGLAVGDLVTIDVGVTSGRYDPVGLRGRGALVVTVDPDYDSGVTSVTMVVPGVYDAPETDPDADFPALEEGE